MATMPSTSSGTQEQMLVVCETNKESADSEDTSDSGINIYQLDSTSCALESDRDMSESTQEENIQEVDEPEDLIVVDKSTLPIANEEDLQQVDWDIFYSTGELVRKGEGNKNKTMDALDAQINCFASPVQDNNEALASRDSTAVPWKKGQYLFFQNNELQYILEKKN